MGMAAILINRPKPFVQIFNPPLVSEEKSFKGEDGMDEWTMRSDYNSSSSAFGSGELKTMVFSDKLDLLVRFVSLVISFSGQ